LGRPVLISQFLIVLEAPMEEYEDLRSFVTRRSIGCSPFERTLPLNNTTFTEEDIIISGSNIVQTFGLNKSKHT
jgi:hypothetical protein